MSKQQGATNIIELSEPISQSNNKVLDNVNKDGSKHSLEKLANDDTLNTIGIPQEIYDGPPDGGYGWLVLAASFLMQACTFGVASGFGVFVEYYKKNVFHDASYSDVSLIGTLAPTTLAIASFVTGRLCDIFGFRICILVWHLIITQGFMFGLGSSLIYVPSNTILAHWFEKRRGLAFGIGASGSGIGGLVFSLINEKLLNSLEFRWALRANALIFLVLLTFSTIVAKPRIPISSSSSEKKKAAPITVAMILNPKALLFIFNAVFASFGYLVPLYYVPSYATSINLTPQEGASIVAILNGCSAIGRILLGFVGDKFGHIGTYIGCIGISTLAMLIWRYSTNFAGLAAFAVVFGLPIGGFASGFPAVCAILFGVENLSTMMGITYAPTGLGDLAGTPIAGLIYDKYHEFGYLVYYSLALFAMSTLMMIILKFVVVDPEKKKKKQMLTENTFN